MKRRKIEVWKPIKQDPRYIVSSKGRIARLRKPWIKYGRGKQGYLYVRFGGREQIKQHKIHRLVAEAFLRKGEGKEIVNHKDGNHFNNKVENLKWVTQSENNKHAYKVGLRK